MERLRITVDGKTYDVVVERTDDGTAAATAPLIRPTRTAAPVAVAAAAPSPASSAAPVAGAGDMASPLAGIVQAVDVAVGAQVQEGDLILTLEAMKMYTPINATASGTVKAVHVKVGDSVEEGQPLVTIA